MKNLISAFLIGSLVGLFFYHVFLIPQILPDKIVADTTTQNIAVLEPTKVDTNKILKMFTPELYAKISDELKKKIKPVVITKYLPGKNDTIKILDTLYVPIYPYVTSTFDTVLKEFNLKILTYGACQTDFIDLSYKMRQGYINTIIANNQIPHMKENIIYAVVGGSIVALIVYLVK